MTRIGDMTLHEGNRVVIAYDPQLRILNLDHLPRGTGAPYLEVLPVLHGDQWVYIAKGWRKATAAGGAFVRFSRHVSDVSGIEVAL